MKRALLMVLLASVLTGCTTRGGWPRFLRPGEPSDAELARRTQELLKQQPGR